MKQQYVCHTKSLPFAHNLGYLFFIIFTIFTTISVQSETLNGHTTHSPKSCRFQQGWTHNVFGGLGGKIIHVTNLNKSGNGSFKKAIKAQGPRIVVFDVAGTIDLDGSIFKVRNPHLTIAGQTAPSPGITLIKGGLKIQTHDVVIQHLRVRPGASGQTTGWDPDGISVSGGKNIIIDHCSISWAVDENLSASGPKFDGKNPDEWRANTSHNITFSNNIIAEALDDSTHPDGAHSQGALIQDNVSNVLIYRNLYASNRSRNPRLKGGARAVIVNNMIVNPGKNALRFGHNPEVWRGKPLQTGQLSIVGNIVRLGKDTHKKTTLLDTFGPLEAYLHDNIVLNQDNKPLASISRGKFTSLKSPQLWPETLTASTSEDIQQNIWKTVGARPWDRDDTDKRIIQQAKSLTTRVINSELEVGGFTVNATHKPAIRAFNPKLWDPCFEQR